MKFVIAETNYLESGGFDTTDWRKSLDGTKSLGHIEWIRVLLPDVLTNANCTVYDAESDEFQALLKGLEWTAQI